MSTTPYTTTVTTPPTAWKSLPSPVRFAGWVWAVLTIAWVIGAAIGAVIWLIVLAVGLGSL